MWWGSRRRVGCGGVWGGGGGGEASRLWKIIGPKRGNTLSLDRGFVACGVGVRSGTRVSCVAVAESHPGDSTYSLTHCLLSAFPPLQVSRCSLAQRCRARRRRLMKATMMERAKETASRAKDAAANAAKHDPKFAGLLTAGGALLSETKKKFEESRGALMLSTFDKLEPKLAGFMLHVYATKIKPGLTTDKWMPESMRSDTRSNCEARQACY